MTFKLKNFLMLFSLIFFSANIINAMEDENFGRDFTKEDFFSFGSYVPNFVKNIWDAAIQHEEAKSKAESESFKDSCDFLKKSSGSVKNNIKKISTRNIAKGALNKAWNGIIFVPVKSTDYIAEKFGDKVEGISKNTIDHVDKKTIELIKNSEGIAQNLTKNALDQVNKLQENIQKDLNDNVKDLTKNIAVQVEDLQIKVQKNFKKDFKEVKDELNQNMKDFKDDFKNDIEDLKNQAKDDIKEILKDGRNVYFQLLAATAGVTLGVMAGNILINKINKYLSQPVLFNETSAKKLSENIKDFFFVKEDPILPPMFFSSILDKKLKDLVAVAQVVTRKIKEGDDVFYRNLLLYGPPGTGKTMFAKQLAIQSGMEYRSMSGSSFSKFSKVADGIEALDQLFNYAKKTKKKLLIFIDESENFLAKRDPASLATENNKLITNFIGHTGTESKNFMLVFATNHPDSLDPAVLSRVSDKVEIGLPELNERKRIISHYRDFFLCNNKKNSIAFIDSAKTVLNDQRILDISSLFKGFSGRDLMQFVNKIKTDSSITESGLVTNYVVDNVISASLAEHARFDSQHDNAVAN